MKDDQRNTKIDFGSLCVLLDSVVKQLNFSRIYIDTFCNIFIYIDLTRPHTLQTRRGLSFRS